ncbi:hypothetical protein AGABI1DRAFT_111158 [Agaricus bisporus var. burnettii JB137-S8]|uniref:NADP-dependent oxidoreductase domain-containing protein n=2 Tax=Agaricus bisporus var. burnettii TaxID=192524 RepID=K5XH02_AGABU|nr:uncharacterized protein AGABI1DRAFT_111158 [Agaricus bisporus var. burnettii JB137-S8]EKM82552.1 hypothetical protein AGABI1DRAFT_111158 [Agaricus bisporus var. burnettii JB137-S8]KAF7778605.1 hypothetical protein Agabi119p4_2950 [Agaricus bisporus var. burnettii]
MLEFTLNDGNRIPAIAFGTGTALYNQDASAFVRLAIETGITHLDGAQMYENEETLGKGIKSSGKPRSELFITTKLHILKPGQTVRETLVESLGKIGVDYVDLFLIHDPTANRKEATLSEIWSQLEALKNEGLTKSIGVSNFKVEDLNEILPGAKIIPAVNQIEFHPYVLKAASPIIELCKAKGIIVASYGGQTPIVRVTDGPLKDLLPKIRERLEQTRGSPVTEGQVLTKWLLQKNVIAISTSSKESRIKEFLSTVDVPDLTKQEIESIDNAGSTIHKRIYMKHIFNE